MGKRSFLQTAGAIVSALYTAFSLIPDIKGETTQDWPWASLVSFIVFVVLIGWIIYDKQERINDYERGRPQLTFGDKTEINVKLQEEKSMGVSSLYLRYQNTGSRPAYQFRMRVGYAPEGNPSRFMLFTENTSANPIYPSDPQQGVLHTFAYKYEVKDGKKTTKAPKGVLIHCALSYSDASSGGRSYSEEWWYSYRFDEQRFSSLSIRRREELEPYVRLAYSKVEKTN